MLTSGTAPPIPVKDSWAELTEPFDAAVVTAAHSVLATIPLRCSLPSRLPPVVPSPEASRSIPAAFCAGEPFCSAA